ncbi:pfkb family carbohydrate kinase superfamily, partial [Moniliophthora roreri]
MVQMHLDAMRMSDIVSFALRPILQRIPISSQIHNQNATAVSSRTWCSQKGSQVSYVPIPSFDAVHVLQWQPLSHHFELWSLAPRGSSLVHRNITWASNSAGPLWGVSNEYATSGIVTD